MSLDACFSWGVGTDGVAFGDYDDLQAASTLVLFSWFQYEQYSSIYETFFPSSVCMVQQCRNGQDQFGIEEILPNVSSPRYSSGDVRVTCPNA